MTGAPRNGAGRRAGIALFVTLAAWAVFTWPLPRHAASGIPSSDRNVEQGHVREMIPGDHLQLLYHFQLVADMTAGRIPWWHNPYEFNLGPDSERATPDPYYMPFSLLYALLAPRLGPAGAWNAAGWVGLFLTFWLTWRLVRRYTTDPAAAFLGALVGFALPYRWITLLTGSPTGFGMTWVPALLLGLDVAVRDRRARGGWLAGVALLCGYGSDLHVFFFQVLATPAWCVFAWIAAPRRDLRGSLRALVPAVLLGVATLGLGLALHRVGGTDLAEGRALRDVARFSPLPVGLVSWRNLGVSNHVFFGSALALLLAAGLCAVIKRARSVQSATLPSSEGWPARLGRAGRGGFSVPTHPLFLLLPALAALVCLALGTNGPFEGLAARACRAAIPRFDMIRQPVKIYCLLPTVAAVACAQALAALGACAGTRRTALAVMAAAASLVIVESRFQLGSTVCRLDARQGAYAAVAADARAAAAQARALVLPLWPGDSHYTSLYQYNAARHRVRMVNGYAPTMRDFYYTDVYLRFESANQGLLRDAQLDWLLQRGIGHVIFQEGPYPEQVAPFPAAAALVRLLGHPRLRLLEQDRLAWAFRILGQPADPPPAAPDWSCRFPARTWEGEALAPAPDAVRADPTAQGGHCLRLGAAGVALETRRPVAGQDGLRWLLRVRGAGVLSAAAGAGETLAAPLRRTPGTNGWTWVAVPVPLERDGFEYARLALRAETGAVDVDAVVLAAGPWPDWAAGTARTFPAACFFRAGYTEAPAGAIVLRRASEADRTVLYGPRLPLASGVYTVRLVFRTDAPAGTQLGMLSPDGGPATPVRAGTPCRVRIARADNRLWSMAFTFSRAADMRIDAVSLERIE
jgi:hypothetical protein